jgi:hypothetical protein
LNDKDLDVLWATEFYHEKMATGGGVENEEPTHIINCDVYFIDEFEDFHQEAVPEYELKGYDLDEILSNDSNFLYIEKGEEGFYDSDEEYFETETGSTTRLKKNYVTKIKDTKIVARGASKKSNELSELKEWRK